MIKREFMGSEFTRWSFKFPSSKILEEGIFMTPVSPWIFEVKPMSEYK